MRRIVSRPGSACALLLAAVVVSTPGGLRAAGGPLPPDLRLVPADAAGFATARVAAVAGKLGLEDRHDFPELAAWEKQLGLQLAGIERLTMVIPAGSAGDAAYIVHTAKPCDCGRIMKALVPGAKAVKHSGKVIHVSGDVAVCFAEDRLFVTGPEKLVRHVVKTAGPDEKGPLAAGLREAAGHDLFAWTRPASPEGPPTRAVTSYKRAPEGPKAPPRTMTSLPLLDGIDYRAPAGVESAEVAADVGDRLSVRVCLHFTDEGSARRGAKVVPAAIAGVRAMLLMVDAELSLLDAGIDLDEGSEDEEADAAIAALAPKVLPVIRSVEKALQHARATVEGTSVPLTVNVAVSPKKLRTALVAGVRLATTSGCDVLGCAPNAPLAPGYGVPAPEPLGAPKVEPEYRLPAPYSPDWGSPAYPWATADTPSVAPCPKQPQALPTCPVSGLVPAAAVCPAATSVKLTVANVSRDAALLFTEDEKGKLVFRQKVPVGEAVDLTTTAGTRWVAVTGGDDPAAEKHVAAPEKTTWLLRPPPRPELR